MYSPQTNNPCWITVVTFEHYHETFYEKCLCDFKDEGGEKFVPTAHQYRQTYLNALYELQRKKYRVESGITEADLDAFEKKIFKPVQQLAVLVGKWSRMAILLPFR